MYDIWSLTTLLDVSYDCEEDELFTLCRRSVLNRFLKKDQVLNLPVFFVCICYIITSTFVNCLKGHLKFEIRRQYSTSKGGKLVDESGFVEFQRISINQFQ